MEKEPIWQRVLAFFNPEPEDKHKKLKQALGYLLVLLLILLLLFSCSSLALIGYQNIKTQDTRSRLFADYSPWELANFQAVDPDIIKEIEQDLIAQGLIQEGDLDPSYYDGLLWWIPGDATDEEIKQIIQSVILLTSQPTQVSQITTTPTPVFSPTATITLTPTPSTPTATSGVVIPPGPIVFPTNTPTETPIPIPGGTISGIVFEDVNYSGGNGKAYSAGDLRLQNVTVELYDSGNSYISSVNTDGNGFFSFTVSNDGTYIIRAVTSTIGDGDTPPNDGVTGYAGTPIIEQTYEHNGVSGNGGSGAMGGNNSQVSDYGIAAGNVGDANVSVNVNSADVPGVQLGFSYNVITNTKDGGQGSLRQYIINALKIDGNSTGYFHMDTTNDPNFANPNFTISPGSAYPPLNDGTGAIRINGTEANGYTVIVDGGSAGAVDGFSLGSGNTVTNLTIQNFTNFGIQISNGSGNTVSNNTITGNNQGVNITGNSSTGNNITGNTLNSNVADGLEITNGANNNTVSGNTIRFNGDDGIDIDIGGNNNLISGNTISNNTATGIDITETTASTNNNTISGNIINSNGGDGIILSGANVYGNVISGNTINSNTDDGIEITNNSYNHTIDNNTINSNGDDGVIVYLTAYNIRIRYNTIASNGQIDSSGDGVHVDGLAASLVLISQNEIWNSADIGIQLTAGANGTNDAGTISVPTISSITDDGAGNLTIVGTSYSGAVLEFFDVTNGGTVAANGSGAGEGPVYLGSFTEGSGADANGTAGSFTFVLSGSGLATGDTMTATQTDGDNETSQFATNVVITP